MRSTFLHWIYVYLLHISTLPHTTLDSLRIHVPEDALFTDSCAHVFAFADFSPYVATTASRRCSCIWCPTDLRYLLRLPTVTFVTLFLPGLLLPVRPRFAYVLTLHTYTRSPTPHPSPIYHVVTLRSVSFYRVWRSFTDHTPTWMGSPHHYRYTPRYTHIRLLPQFYLRLLPFRFVVRTTLPILHIPTRCTPFRSRSFPIYILDFSRLLPTHWLHRSTTVDFHPTHFHTHAFTRVWCTITVGFVYPHGYLICAFLIC